MISETQNYSLLSKRPEKTYQICKSKILCNYFPLETTKTISQIYIFSIEMTPHLPQQKLALRTRVLSLLEAEIGRIITKPVIIGMSVYSLFPPLFVERGFFMGEHRVVVRQVRVVQASEDRKGLLIVLQKVIRSLMLNRNYNILPRSHKYFNMKKKVQHYAVNVYSGYHVDFVKSQSLFYLRIDSSRKIVCSQTALDAIDYCYKLCRTRDKVERRRFIKDRMVGRTVMANYGKNRFYKIRDVSFGNLQFQRLEDDKPLVEYYQQKYGVFVKNLSQPLLVISTSPSTNKKPPKKCLLIPQLCFMVGLPQQLEQSKQKNILAGLKLHPEDSRSESKQLMENLAQSVEEWRSLQKIGVSLVGVQMCSIQGKKLPKPQLLIGGGLRVQRGLETMFNLACRPIYRGGKFLRCAVLFFSRVDVSLLSQILERNSRDIGVQVEFKNFSIGQFSNNKALTQIQTSLDQACSEYNPNMILLILPTVLKTYYKNLKKSCLVHYKTLSQFLSQSTLTHRHNTTIFGKILLQMLAKRGNLLWIPQQVQEIKENNRIIFIGVYSEKCGGKVVVGSCCTGGLGYQVGWSGFGVWDGRAQRTAKEGAKGKAGRDVERADMELLEVMVKNVIDCLEFWRKKNGALPDQVIILSKNGNIQMGINKFKNKFVTAIKKSLDEYFDGPFCMTYIMVQTKDSTKFFIHDNPHTKARNTEIGTVVDEVIVPENQFLMVTHSTPGVSAIPIRFKILFSDSKIPKTMLQQLLFNQCFAYANYTGLIQIPAILQYAKKCAKYVSQSPFSQKLQSHLEECPYYL